MEAGLSSFLEAIESRCILELWSKVGARVVVHYEWARGVSAAESLNPLVEV